MTEKCPLILLDDCEHLVESVATLAGAVLSTVPGAGSSTPCPVRVNAEAATWFDVVRQVVDRERESYPHRRVPPAVIQEDLGRSVLVDTLFNFVHLRPRPGGHEFQREWNAVQPTADGGDGSAGAAGAHRSGSGRPVQRRRAVRGASRGSGAGQRTAHSRVRSVVRG